MLRIAAGRVGSAIRGTTVAPRAAAVGLNNIRSGHGGPKETDEEFDNRYEAFFNRPDIDHWEIRSAMNRLAVSDLIPEPRIIIAALKACRRLNDYALAVRYLESIKDKCGYRVDKIYPYVLENIKPTLDELGINTPEELGYDKPELALESVDDIH